MPKLAVPSLTRAQPSPRSSTLKEDGDRSGQSSARRGPNSVRASQTTFGSRSVATVYVTLATEFLLRDLLVDRLVREIVGAAVLDAFHVGQGAFFELAQELHGALMEWNQLWRLDLVAAVHLLDDKLRVEVHLEPIGVPVLHGEQALKQCVVLGFVVRCPAEVAVKAA